MIANRTVTEYLVKSKNEWFFALLKRLLAPLERFELPTNRFEAGYSIQLSYRGEI